MNRISISARTLSMGDLRIQISNKSYRFKIKNLDAKSIEEGVEKITMQTQTQSMLTITKKYLKKFYVWNWETIEPARNEANNSKRS